MRIWLRRGGVPGEEGTTCRGGNECGVGGWAHGPEQQEHVAGGGGVGGSGGAGSTALGSWCKCLSGACHGRQKLLEEQRGRVEDAETRGEARKGRSRVVTVGTDRRVSLRTVSGVSHWSVEYTECQGHFLLNRIRSFLGLPSV